MFSARFFGVHEMLHESDEQCLQIVLHLLEKALPEIPWSLNRITCAMRMNGTAFNGLNNSPRPVLVFFLRNSDKILVLKRARKALRRMNVRVSGRPVPEYLVRTSQNDFPTHPTIPRVRGRTPRTETARLEQNICYEQRPRKVRTHRRELRPRTLVQVNLQEMRQEFSAPRPARHAPDEENSTEEVVVRLLSECRQAVQRETVSRGCVADTVASVAGSRTDLESADSRDTLPQTRDSCLPATEDDDSIGSPAQEDCATPPATASPAAPTDARGSRGIAGDRPQDDTSVSPASHNRAVQSSILHWLQPSDSGPPEGETRADGNVQDKVDASGKDEISGPEVLETNLSSVRTSTLQSTGKDLSQSRLHGAASGSARGNIWHGRLRGPPESRSRNESLNVPSCPS